MEGLGPMRPLPGKFSFSHCFHYLRSSKGAEEFWRPLAVHFCFSVSVFTGSASAERNTRLLCVSFLSKCICMRKWLTAGFFLSLLCPSFCLLLTRHLPVLANRCIPSHASHLAAGSLLLLNNLKAVFAEVLKAVSSFQVTRKACNPSENQDGCFWFEINTIRNDSS